MKKITNRLFEMQDLKYRDFHSRLMPTVDKSLIIGVRTPELRKFSKEIFGTKIAADFLKEMPHKYYEENNLHAFLIAKIQDFDLCIEELDRFLPYIDNWATCDMLRPVCFSSNKEKLLLKIKEWINEKHTYTIRFAIEMLMVHFLDGDFIPEYLDYVANAPSSDYYLMMVRAWYFATALAKQYDLALPYLEQKTLDFATHNKAIQKAVESFRLTDTQKTYLKTLKINKADY